MLNYIKELSDKICKIDFDMITNVVLNECTMFNMELYRINIKKM